VPEFIEPEKLPLNNPDLNPVDYSLWAPLEQMVYRHKISDINRLKCVLIDCWIQLSQDMLNQAIDQLRKGLMMVRPFKAKRAHVAFGLDMVSVLVCMLTTRRYMVVALHQLYQTYSSAYRHALTKCIAGCGQTGFS